MKNHKPHRKSFFASEAVFYTIIAGMMLVIIVCVLFAGVKLSLSNAENVYNRTMDYMKRQCVSYSDFVASDEVKSLIRLTEQADDISYALQTMNEDVDTFLAEHKVAQRLSAAIILDKNLEPEYSVYSDGLSYDLLSHEILSPAIKSVFENPKKIYSERFEINDKIYDIAVVARRDSDGVVICCRYQSDNTLRMSHSSVESLLAGYETVLNGTLYITDGEKIIASNSETRYINANEVEALKLLESRSENSSLIRFTTSDGMFYGGEERYQEYHIYAYFPAGDVYTTLRNIMTISFALMAIVVLFIVLLHFRLRYAHAMEISDQFNTIKAVGSIYVMNILIDLRHNRLRFLIPVEEFKDVDVSRRADDIFRHEFRDYIGEKYRDEYMAFCDLSTLRQRLSGKDFIEMEYQNTAGEWLSDIIIPKYNERGKFDSVLLLTKNINEEKKTELEYQKKLEEAVEREKAANSAKTDFLRRMSHDVRTPINVILGMLEIGERNPEDIEGQKRRHATAHAAADYLLELVNGVLTLNEAVDGDTHNTVEFCIPDEMNKVYKLMNPQAEKKSITLDFSAPDSRTVLYGNALYLRQIFINIVGNAVKFTQDGGRIVCSAAEKVNSDGKTADVRFTCSDNGCGMSKEFQTRMFEPFAKEDNGYDSEYGGMGLGLSLVKDLAQKMGGSISVKSEQGKGTVFEVVIPFKVAAGEKPPKSSQDTVPDDISGVNVLIAEDNKLNMEIAEYLLADSGANVTEAYNGREAADLFMKSAPGEIDIILMDMMMPVMSGTEAAMLIRSSGRRDAKTIPILAMTADLFAKDSEDYKKGGFNGFVAKPIDAKALVAAVARYVKKGKNTDDAT